MPAPETQARRRKGKDVPDSPIPPIAPVPQMPEVPGTERIVLCMKWGRLFSPDYVNVLFNACRRNLTGPFRFICLTEDAQGFAAGIEALPLPDVGLAPQEWYTKGVWPKLGLFLRDLHGLSGRYLFIDLDMVIAGPLDAFFEQPGRFISTDMGAGWRPQGRRAGGSGAGWGGQAGAGQAGAGRRRRRPKPAPVSLPLTSGPRRMSPKASGATGRP